MLVIKFPKMETLLILDPTSFLIYVSNTKNYPQSTAFAAFQNEKFW